MRNTFRHTGAFIAGSIFFSMVVLVILFIQFGVIPIAIKDNATFSEFALFIGFELIFVLDGLFLYYGKGTLGEVAFGKLTVYEDRVQWKCFGRFSVTLKYSDVRFVGLESDNKAVGGPGVIRGDERIFIYLSETAYPAKYHEKIHIPRNKKGFIKFKYSDRLCEALLKVLPPEKCGSLRGFYSQMQLADERMAKERERERQKRARQKAKKAKKKDKG